MAVSDRKFIFKKIEKYYKDQQEQSNPNQLDLFKGTGKSPKIDKPDIITKAARK